MNCKNCNQEVNSNFCSNCGQPASIKRINGDYIIQEIGQVLNFEKGILYTIRELLLRPGENVRKFISENRSRLIKPIIFIIISSLIYSLINNFFKIEDTYIKQGGLEASSVGKIFKWVQENYGYANIIMGVFIAFWTRLFFKKYDYNFYEILILLCFAMGMGMLIFALFAFLQGITKFELMSTAGIIGFAYITWAIGQFFDKNKPLNYLKAFFAYIFGALSSVLLAIAIGLIMDAVLK